MTTKLLQSNNVGYYGSTAYSTQNGFSGGSGGMPFKRKDDHLVPVSDISVVQSALNISSVFYVVRERVGPWWSGACFRKTRSKIVLRDITLQAKAGEVTAILGNSG